MKKDDQIRALIDAFTDFAERVGASEQGTMESLLDIFDLDELADLGYRERVEAYCKECGIDDWPA